MQDLSLEKSPKVLVVCMLDSVHTARWLSMFKNENINFTLFPSTPNRALHPEIKKLIQNNQIAKYSTIFKVPYLSILLWGIGLISSLILPAKLLIYFAKKQRINQIHAIELNHAGYLVSRAHSLGLPPQIKIIVTNWGSDIYWFQKFPNHRKKLKKLMEISDLYTAECTRDIKLASDLGFKGIIGEVFPNAGGFSITEINKINKIPSQRSAIVIKGYESFVGRASIALEALAQINSELKEYEIYIYSANLKTIKKARKLRKKYNLNVIVYPKKNLTHSQVLDLFRKSRIYVGVSLSDAISTSLLEAMVTGAFPIQTNTSCADEWIIDDLSGCIVSPSVDSVKNALLRALSDNNLVDTAAKLNSETARARLNAESIQSKLKDFYNLKH